jgi:hypothetical protein
MQQIMMKKQFDDENGIPLQHQLAVPWVMPNCDILT